MNPNLWRLVSKFHLNRRYSNEKKNKAPIEGFLETLLEDSLNTDFNEYLKNHLEETKNTYL